MTSRPAPSSAVALLAAAVTAVGLATQLAACSRPASAPGASPSPEDAAPAAPQTRGTKRALVLVDDAKKPEPPKERVDDQYSTKRIVEKVTGSP